MVLRLQGRGDEPWSLPGLVPLSPEPRHLYLQAHLPPVHLARHVQVLRPDTLPFSQPSTCPGRPACSLPPLQASHPGAASRRPLSPRVRRTSAGPSLGLAKPRHSLCRALPLSTRLLGLRPGTRLAPHPPLPQLCSLSPPPCTPFPTNCHPPSREPGAPSFCRGKKHIPSPAPSAPSAASRGPASCVHATVRGSPERLPLAEWTLCPLRTAPSPSSSATLLLFVSTLRPLQIPL